jgi:gliding motility-associatede transport system auxiliary component
MLTRILNFLGWIGALLVFAGAAIRFGYPAQEQYVPYLVWSGLACIVAYGAGQWREIAEAFKGRQARYGTLAGVSVLVVLGILIAVNYIGARQNKRWDLTANKSFSLSDQSRKVLEGLDSPLHLMVFVQEPDFSRFKDRLQEYEYLSKQMTTEYVDPDKKPAVARQNEVQQYGTIVFNYKGRTERVTITPGQDISEQDLTNAIIKAVSGQQRKVYFVQGHGERDTTSQERNGYAGIAAALGRENYAVDKVVLAQTGAVPDDASAVIVAGPSTDFLPAEIEALNKYLAKSGKVLLELDPLDTPDAPPLTNLIAFARSWGIDVGANVIVDGSGMGQLIGTDATAPVVAKYGTHPIGQKLNVMTAYPLSRSVAPVPNGVEGRTAQPFAETSERSIAIRGDVKTMIAALTAGEKLTDSKIDKRGPVPIAAAVSAPSTAPATGPSANPLDPEAPKPESRVAVIGDADFAANAYLGIQGNRDMFMNTLGWLSQQENLIAIRPKEAGDRRITLTATQQTLTKWFALLIVPACIFGTGILSWSRRRS